MKDNMIKLNGIIHSKIETHMEDKLVPVLPKSLFSMVVEHYHNVLGHPGINRTYLTIRNNFEAPNILQSIKEYISKCEVCQTSKPSDISIPKFEPILIPNIPFTSIAGDIWQYIYKKYIFSILSFIDLTSCLWLPFIINDETSYSIGKCMISELFCKIGIPEIIRFDQQSSLRFSGLLRLLKSFNIKVKHNTTKHHTGNSLIERSFRTLKQLLKSSYFEYSRNNINPISKTEFISQYLNQIAFKYNSTICMSLKDTPFRIFSTEKVILLIIKLQWTLTILFPFMILQPFLEKWNSFSADDVKIKEGRNMKLPNNFNLIPEYHKNELILIMNNNQKTKLEPAYVGPYSIIYQIGSHIFVKSDYSKGRAKKDPCFSSKEVS